MDDSTDLTTLTGEADQFLALVEKKFKSDDEAGNLTWGILRCSTYTQLLDDFAENGREKAFLRAWVQHYQLEDGFKIERDTQQQQQQQSTPAAKTQPSRAALKKICEFCSSTRATVMIHGSSWSTAADFERELKKDAVFSSARTRIIENLESPRSYDGLTEKPITADFSQLQIKTEDEFQKEDMQKGFFKEKETRALDLHLANNGAPFFSTCQQHGDERVYFRDGKPDGVSKATPMEIEIKTSFDSKARKGKSSTTAATQNPCVVCWDVLLQALQRVVVRMELSGYVRIAVAFAVSNKTAWMVVGKRFHKEDLSDTHPYIVSLERIGYSDIAKFWMEVTKLADEGPLLMPDGPHICSVLRKFQVEAANCRVRWTGASMSTVYQISVGKTLPRGDKTAFGIDVATATYALKIVRDEESFKAESRALNILGKNDDKFYALAVVPKGEDAEHLAGLQHHQPTAHDMSEEHDPGWWQKAYDVSDDSDFEGAILMRFGKMWDGKNSAHVVDGVLTELFVGHKAGVYHCDLRKTNVASFDGIYRPIDYSLSMADGKYTALASSFSGAQKDCVGVRVRECIKRGDEHIVWTEADDYEMAVNLFSGLLLSTAEPKKKEPAIKSRETHGLQHDQSHDSSNKRRSSSRDDKCAKKSRFRRKSSRASRTSNDFDKDVGYRFDRG